MNTSVSLRKYEKSDAQAMAAAARESFVEVSPWMPWCHAAYSKADAAAWIRATREAHSTGAFYDFAIIDSTGGYAGGCGINHLSPFSGVANLGYWVRSSLAGRGIAPAAVRELVPWVFQHTALNRLEIVAAVGNLRSQRVAEKVGAHRDALLRKRTLVNGLPSDAILYSILRPD
jgi:ribosomal-protein-serine acetyltransferase